MTSSTRVLVLVLGAGLAPACGGGDGTATDARANDGTLVDTAGALVDGAAAGWSTAPPVLGGPVQETAVVAVDGRIHVIGGFAPASGGGVTDAVRIYDTATGGWSDGPTLPSPVHHATAVVHDGTIYLLGHLAGIGFEARGTVWALTPGVDTTWRERTAMPTGTERGSAIAGVVGARLVVTGGFRDNTALATTLAYDPALDAWDDALPDLPAARDHACGAAVDGVLHVVGGRDASITSVRATVYALVDGAWVERAPMPTARGGTGCGLVGRELIVVGGEGNGDAPSGVFPQAEAYDVDAATWRTLAPMPAPRHGMGAAGWGDALYVPGGASTQGFGAVDTVEVLVP